MSRIDKLKAKPKIINIGGEEVNIKPLKLKNMDLLMGMSNDEKQADAIKEIISMTLRDAFPDATEEDIQDVSFEHFETLMNAILEVNGLKKNNQ